MSAYAASGLLLWARRAADIDRLLQQGTNAGNATLSVCIHIELVYLCVFSQVSRLVALVP